jgi:ABC-2 type transport system ATP-binding protein
VSAAGTAPAAALARGAATARAAATAPAAAIAVEGLIKRYAARAVLDGVDLAVRPGELVALLGPNGAGKTTTVEIIEGYRRPDGGTVRVLGSDPLTGGPALRARVGLMLQGGGLDPRSTPRDVLRLYAAFHVDGRDPEELLRLVGIEAAARTRVRRLSGGERQRLALALALVGRPEVLILDEPTAGMDPEAKRTTRGLIAQLRGEGLAILMTTHDLVDVERLADRVAILHRGRIIAAGSPPPRTTAAGPRHPGRLTGEPDAAALAELQAQLRGLRPAALVRPEPERGSAAFTVDGARPDPRLIALVAAWAADGDLTIAELHTVSASLEERYLELTGDAAIEAVA